MAEKTIYLANQEDLEELKKTVSAQATNIENLKTGMLNKANGKGITLSVNESGGLRVTYDNGK